MQNARGIDSPVQKIKDRLSIDEVISSYIPLITAGNTLKAKCPFHNEKTPSFFVSKERNSYYCFGCGKGGDIFSFVEEFEGLDFKGALKLLAERANINLNEFKLENTEEKDLLYAVMEEATLFFENNLLRNEKALKYLKLRGLEDKTIKTFRLGFALNDWRSLTNHLKQKNFSFEIIEKAGLAKKKDENSKIEDIYDRFRSRIMFPIMDSSGRVIAFSGRYFKEDDREDKIEPAKYLNSPETPIFIKSNVLYGLHLAKESIRKNNFSILVEGQMDLLMSVQSGFRNTVATSGTALSDSLVSKENTVSNLGLIKRLSNNILLAFDGDNAGLKATDRASKIALGLGMDVKVISLEEGLDPADFILKEGVDSFREVIRNSKHVIVFFLEKIILSFPNNLLKIGKEIREKIFPYLLLLQSAIERSYFLKIISDKTGIELNSLKTDLDKKEQEVNNLYFNKEEVFENTKNDFVDRKTNILKRLFGILFFKESRVDSNFKLDDILLELKDFVDRDTLLSLEKEKDVLIFKIEKNDIDIESLDKEIDELILNLKEEVYKELKKEKEKEILFLSKEKQGEVLLEINSLNIKLEEIKNKRL